MGFNPFEIFQTVGFKKEDPNDKTEQLMQEDVMDVENLDEWTLDDFFIALPKTIEGRWDTICEFHLWYSKETNNWNAAYDTPWGDHTYETSNVDRFECLKQLYFQVKSNSL